MIRNNKSILIISDTHFPYHHSDTISFLKEIKSVYKPDKIVHIGYVIHRDKKVTALALNYDTYNDAASCITIVPRVCETAFKYI